VPFVVGDGETGANVDRPVSLVDLPEIVARAAGVEEGSPADPGDDWVYATDYDGRNDRNLTAVRSQRFKYLLETENGDERRELYDLGADRGETENLVEDHEISDALGGLTDRRVNHEEEILAVRSAAESLRGDDES